MLEIFIYYLLFVVLIVTGILLGMYTADKRSEDMKQEAIRMGNASYYEFMKEWEGDYKDDLSD